MLKKVDPALLNQIKLQGAICFCEWEGKILMLKRSPHCPQGNLWTAAPGGKLESGETPIEAVVREVYEETAITLDPEKLEFKGSYHFHFPDTEYLLHIFLAKLSFLPTPILDPKEHTELRWATPQEALKMPLMRGGTDCLRTVFSL